MTEKSTELRQGLAQFHGTETWYRHLAPHVLYTEGVQYLGEKGEAYWLIDEIAFAQANVRVKAEPFQVWKLVVNQQDMNAVLTCTDGDKGPGPVTVYQKRIEFTDFPLDEIELWVGLDGVIEPKENRVIMLPGEY